jgi:uncharacterized protein YktB (UPF0637 family)
MPSMLFTESDFKVFEIDGFAGRMNAIRSCLRPKLESVGRSLLPDVAYVTGAEAFAHVARHARRTVNPPDDTWVAFAADKRGYKKHPHFKLALSRNCLRFLFEVGPEHSEKARWAGAWKKNAPRLAPVLRRVKGLAWFKDEHDEAPAALLADLTTTGVAQLADELTRTRDAQVVLGRVVSADDAVKWTDAQCRTAASETFRALAPLYRLR